MCPSSDVPSHDEGNKPAADFDLHDLEGMEIGDDNLLTAILCAEDDPELSDEVREQFESLPIEFHRKDEFNSTESLFADWVECGYLIYEPKNQRAFYEWRKLDHSVYLDIEPIDDDIEEAYETFVTDLGYRDEDEDEGENEGEGGSAKDENEGEGQSGAARSNSGSH